MNKLTPVVLLDDIVPTRAFLVDRLGFELVMEIPADPGSPPDAKTNPPGFAILRHTDVELMLQSRESVANDAPDLAGDDVWVGPGGVGLFIEVDSLDDVRAVAASPGEASVTVPERTTFYGKREIGFRLPGGVSMMFAEDVR